MSAPYLAWPEAWRAHRSVNTTITDGYLLVNHSDITPGGSNAYRNVVIIVWLIIGAIAAGQRHYYNSSSTNCAKTSTIAVRSLPPADYVGVNRKSRAQAQLVTHADRSSCHVMPGRKLDARHRRSHIFAIAFLLNATSTSTD